MKKIFSTTHHISRTLALKKQSFYKAHTFVSEGGIHNIAQLDAQYWTGATIEDVPALAPLHKTITFEYG